MTTKASARRTSEIHLQYPLPFLPKGHDLPLCRPSTRLCAFGWYGGKYSHLSWLLPLLPKAHHFCEPFGGSAAVLLNRNPSPVETYNDTDGEIVNFFRVLRNQRDELLEQVCQTPFAREEFLNSISQPKTPLTDLERARLFYVRVKQSRLAKAQAATLSYWANCKLTSQNGMSAKVNGWLNGPKKLIDVSQRLRCVQIENRPALEVVRIYDDPQTLFYCDPPYVLSTRVSKKVYQGEMNDDDHIALSIALKACKARVVLSGYDCELMKSLYSEWRRIEAPFKRCVSSKEYRQEIAWANF